MMLKLKVQRYVSTIGHMKTLPTYEEIAALHRKYAPSKEAFELVFTHCQVVWEIAEQLIKKSNLDVDVDLVKAGCLLHDLGVYRVYLSNGEVDRPNYIRHGIEGYAVLKEEGFSELLCRFASCHTGVGITKQDVKDQGLPIPSADYVAETVEEQLVMYADNFHTKSTPPKFQTADTYTERLRQFGEDKVERFKELQEQFGLPDLQVLAEKYGAEVV